MVKKYDIPYPVKGDDGRQNPAYSRCWWLINKKGMSRDDAVAQAEKEIKEGTLSKRKPREKKVLEAPQKEEHCAFKPLAEESPENRCWSLMIIALLKQHNSLMERIVIALESIDKKTGVK